MSSVRDGIAALTEAQRAVVRDKTVTAEHRPLDWLDVLGPLLTVAERTATERSRAGTRLGIAWLVFVVGFFVAIIGGAAGGAVVGLVGFVIIVASVTAVALLMVERRRLKQVELPPAPLRFVLGLLPILAEDAAGDATLGLALDLRGHQAPEKGLGASEPYARGAYHRVVETFFHDPFLSGRVRFADGADVVLQAGVRSRVQRKTKRNPRGKIKTKVKTKCRTSYEVSVAFPVRNYAAALTSRPAAPGGDRERVKRSANRTTVRERRVVKSAGASPQLHPGHVVDLLAHAYDRVAPARRKKLG